MIPSDTPSSPNPESNTALYATAPWSVKRILLAAALNKTAKANDRQTITTSVTAYDLTDHKLIYTHNIDFEHYAASTQKIPIVTLVLQDLRAGKVTMDTILNWSDIDRRDGAGVYDAVGSPTTGTVRDVIFDMLNRSGNTAIRILVNKVLGGAAATNDRLAAYPQLKVTRLQPVDADRFLVGYTTARESAFMFNMFYQETDGDTEFAKHALATNIFNDYGPRSQVQDHDKMVVIDKQGMLNDPEGNNRHDIGVIRNTQTHHEILYTLFTTSPGDSGLTLIAPAEESLKTMGRSLLSYEGDTAAQPLPFMQQKAAATDKTIEHGRMHY
jgi:beta-lactamase class A